MGRSDGFYYCPDNGLELQIKGDSVYWEDGDIDDRMTVGLLRAVPITSGKEPYADWSDERRAQVKAEFAAERRNPEETMEDVEVEIYLGRTNNTWDTITVTIQVPVQDGSILWSDADVEEAAIDTAYDQVKGSPDIAFIGVYHWDPPFLDEGEDDGEADESAASDLTDDPL